MAQRVYFFIRGLTTIFLTVRPGSAPAEHLLGLHCSTKSQLVLTQKWCWRGAKNEKSAPVEKIQDKVGAERDTGQREGMPGMILRVALAIAVLGAAHGVVYTGTTETSIPPDPVCTLETRTMQV